MSPADATLNFEKPMNTFITGTDTGVGKTFATALLLRHLRRRGIDCVPFKPICCGVRTDAEILLAAAGDEAVAAGLTINEINPLWLRTPAAPWTAAMIEGRPLDLALVRDTYAALRARHPGGVLVEGVGGWLVPITRELTVADLAREMNLPVIVVVKNRLGALNHTLLTVRHLQSIGLKCAGLIFNAGPTLNAATADAETEAGEAIACHTNRAVCEDLLGVPILAELTHAQLDWPGENV